ncbi:YggS family pyridoxal phosphate-dependent enzyme [Herbaspirillum autotrophicum]|uniref:YggS family pyridoxal phosphate-dependent enzyme n=1 Tax=Herbaspirillum autotrophicum TaxID=180195 RepID=UPI00067DDB6F|nr:YggS family pyridoxal phosphate-dependent enzyme [Herbaspirillum autotrophicum]
MSSIAEKLQVVNKNIANASVAAGRDPAQVRLLAVSKTFDADAVLAAVTAGQRAFGENYLQEALDKIAALRVMAPEAMLEWHFIGPIQSNKTRPIAENFDWVHTIDRERIAQRLSEQRPAGMAPLNVCIQVNISAEASKSGVVPAEAAALAHVVSGLPGLRLRGLMAIPAPADAATEQRAAFRQVRLLQEQLQQQGLALDTLSMGMSGDMPQAIAEGATMVRIGSAIFGQRPPIHS